jgi:hypothetical protein
MAIAGFEKARGKNAPARKRRLACTDPTSMPGRQSNSASCGKSVATVIAMAALAAVAIHDLNGLSVDCFALLAGKISILRILL